MPGALRDHAADSGAGDVEQRLHHATGRGLQPVSHGGGRRGGEVAGCHSAAARPATAADRLRSRTRCGLDAPVAGRTRRFEVLPCRLGARRGHPGGAQRHARPCGQKGPIRIQATAGFAAASDRCG